MPHYFDKNQTSEFKPHLVKALLRNREYEFISASGIFSATQVDIGTALLINESIIYDGWDVLDFGCGFGAVGVAMANEFRNCKVVMTDINERAVLVSKKNVEKYNLNNCEVVSGNMFEPLAGREFDTILINPPYVAGKEAIFKIIEESRLHLKKNGLLQLVFRHNKGGKTVMKKMEDVFGNVKDIAKGADYRVYASGNV